LPLSTSVNSATSSQFAGIDKAGDGGALGVEPEAGLALPVGRDAIVGDKPCIGLNSGKRPKVTGTQRDLPKSRRA
jgi:hypothetical protein